MNDIELMEGEELRPIEGTRNYLVSNMGRVYSTHSKRFLKQSKNKFGYWVITLCVEGKTHRTMVSRLVAKAFCEVSERHRGKSYNELEVNHIDENKDNNSHLNLEWITRIENVRHGTGIERRKENRIAKGGTCPVAQYSLEGDYIASYPSANQANITVSGKTGASVYLCARGSAPTAYGYRWIALPLEDYQKGTAPVKLGPIVPYSKQAEFEKYNGKVMQGPMMDPKGVTRTNKKKKARKKIKNFHGKKWKRNRKTQEELALEGETFVPLPVKGLRKLYTISDLGRIYDVRYGKIVPVHDNIVYLYGGFYRLPLLVYVAFKSRIPRYGVSHKNGDKTDNRLENLKKYVPKFPPYSGPYEEYYGETSKKGININDLLQCKGKRRGKK